MALFYIQNKLAGINNRTDEIVNRKKKYIYRMTCLERDDNTSSGIIFVGEIQQKKKYEKNVSFVLDANCHLIVKREKKTKRRNDDMTKGKNTRYEYMLLLGNEHLPLSRSNSSISAFAFFPFTVKFLFCSFFPVFKLLVMFMFLAW